MHWIACFLCFCYWWRSLGPDLSIYTTFSALSRLRWINLLSRGCFSIGTTEKYISWKTSMSQKSSTNFEKRKSGSKDWQIPKSVGELRIRNVHFQIRAIPSWIGLTCWRFMSKILKRISATHRKTMERTIYSQTSLRPWLIPSIIGTPIIKDRRSQTKNLAKERVLSSFWAQLYPKGRYF